MVFPLFKTWLRPLVGSHLLSSKKKYGRASNRYIQTIGGGGGNTDPRSWARRGPPSANPITVVSFNESEEKVVNEVMLHNITVGHVVTTTAPVMPNAILVSNEFEISEDRASNAGENTAQRVHEPW